ncbi:MAG: hypothetical protein AAF999_03550 [Pseudomonadota bacterium]
MDSDSGKLGTALGCWIVSFGIGTLAGTALWVLGGWGFLQACFVGLTLFLVLGALFSWVMMRPLPAPNALELTTPPVPGSAPKPAAPKAAPASAPAPVAAAPEPAAKKAPAKKPAAKKKAEAEKSSDDRPAMMSDAPEGGAADDLKKISGVGPKLEQTLNELGIWHYEQVAQLTKKDIAWVDERLRFKGRIERDDWVGQARELAKAKG